PVAAEWTPGGDDPATLVLGADLDGRHLLAGRHEDVDAPPGLGGRRDARGRVRVDRERCAAKLVPATAERFAVRPDRVFEARPPVGPSGVVAGHAAGAR